MKSLLLILRTRRYFAPAWAFASLNIVVGTWAIYIPTVKDRLALDDAALGLALLAFSMGTLSIVPLSSWLIGRVGLGRITAASVVAFAFSMVPPLLAPSLLALCGCLFVAGALAGLLDVAMNSLVSELEKADDAHFMSAAHGFFSMGGVIGAGIGSLLIPFFAAPWQHALLVAGFILLTTALVAGNYISSRSPETDRGEGGFRMSLLRPLWGLALLSFLIMGSEGAIEHWSKLYLLDVVKVASDQLAGFGFVAFSATMMLGRFLGDGISGRFGALRIVMGGTLLAAVGYILVLMANYGLSLLGFALVGLGFSVIIPELFRLAGKTKGVSSSEGIALVAGLGYVGFLASPPLLGFLSTLGTLSLSFTVLLGASGVAFLLAFGLYQRRR